MSISRTIQLCIPRPLSSGLVTMQRVIYTRHTHPIMSFQKTSGKYLQMQPSPPTVPILSIGDVVKNLGTFASAILAQPRLTHGRYVFAYVEKTTIGEILQTWSKATGKPSVYVQTASLEDFNRAWPSWGPALGVMMKYWEESGDKSWSGEEFLTRNELGLSDAEFVGIEETFKGMDWSFL